VIINADFVRPVGADK